MTDEARGGSYRNYGGREERCPIQDESGVTLTYFNNAEGSLVCCQDSQVLEGLSPELEEEDFWSQEERTWDRITVTPL